MIWVWFAKGVSEKATNNQNAAAIPEATFCMTTNSILVSRLLTFYFFTNFFTLVPFISPT
jgi:hypothetical protein